MAWHEIEGHLKSGHIKAKADYNRLHEFTQRVLHTDERILTEKWWQIPGRFGRLMGNRVLWTNIQSVPLSGWQDLAKPPHESSSSYTNVMLWMPDIIREYPGIRDKINEPSHFKTGKGEAGKIPHRRRGPAPKTTERVKAAMRLLPVSELRDMKVEVMREQFKAIKIHVH
jgi:hypothetical protein